MTLDSGQLVKIY